MSATETESPRVLQMRLVVEAPDHDVEVGHRSLHRPTRTPWDPLNSRLAGPPGLQITLFEELAPSHPSTTHRTEGARP